jgi:hypothetical protein
MRLAASARLLEEERDCERADGEQDDSWPEVPGDEQSDRDADRNRADREHEEVRRQAEVVRASARL